jgi:hypothetical protein
MISYAFIEDDLDFKKPPDIIKIPPQIQQESECNIILFMFIFAVVALSMGERK